MKCLSVRQPWAWALVNGFKDVENRSWWPGPKSLKPGDALAIHASKSFDHEGYVWIVENRQQLGLELEDIPRVGSFTLGAVVGVTVFYGVVTQSESPWFFGPNGWELRAGSALLDPIPLRGMQRLFNLPDGILGGHEAPPVQEKKTMSDAEKVEESSPKVVDMDNRPKADVTSKASRRLEIELTDSEVADKARNQADLIHDRQEIESDLSDAKKRFGDRIKGITQQVDEIGEEIYLGVVTRPVDCLIEKRFDEGQLVVIRLDTMQIIEERELTAEELAEELDMWLAMDDTGDLLDEAEMFVRATERASATMLQRKFGMGINCAETVIVELAERGVLGPPDKDGNRSILPVPSEPDEPAPEEGEGVSADQQKEANAFEQMFEDQVAEVVALVKSTGRINTASVQRGLNVGYSRAVKIMEALEDREVIGPVREGQPREILIEVEQAESVIDCGSTDCKGNTDGVCTVNAPDCEDRTEPEKEPEETEE